MLQAAEQPLKAVVNRYEIDWLAFHHWIPDYQRCGETLSKLQLQMKLPHKAANGSFCKLRQ